MIFSETDYRIYTFDIFKIDSGGYVNTNQIEHSVGKRIRTWLTEEDTKLFLREFLTHTELDPIVASSGRNRGTWAHPDVAVQFGYWCHLYLGLEISKHVRKWAFNSNTGEITTPLGCHSVEFDLVPEVFFKYDKGLVDYILKRVNKAVSNQINLRNIYLTIRNSNNMSNIPMKELRSLVTELADVGKLSFDKDTDTLIKRSNRRITFE